MIVDVIFIVIELFNYVVLSYFLLLNLAYLTTSLLAFISFRKYIQQIKMFDIHELIQSAGALPITLISPAYNEEATCVESINSLLTLQYPEYEILVVNDGSKDKTLETLTQAFDLKMVTRVPTSNIKTSKVKGVYRSKQYKNLWVIDKKNGGKADALNVGINFSRAPLFCAMDADTLLERDALMRVVRPFFEDSSTVAVGGSIRIVNDATVEHGIVKDICMPKNLLAKFQVLEYLRAFLSGRMGWDAMDSTLIISGAFGLFLRSKVVECGGYSTDTVGEDMELVVKLHRLCREKKIPYRIRSIPDPVAWTECPESTKILGRQRDRWQRGLIETLSRHKVMLCNPKYGRIGTVVFPYFFFLEMLGPLIELPGYLFFAISIIMGWASAAYVTAFLMVTFALGITLSVTAVTLEELSSRKYPKFTDLLQLFAFGIVENFGYRQLTTFWRFKGILSSIYGAKSWGKMERKGFKKAK